MESVRDPKHPDILFKTLPTDVHECIQQIRYYGEHLYKFERLNQFEVVQDCEEVLIHLRYRYYKLLPEELDRDALSFCLLYELRFPSLVYSHKVENVAVFPVLPLFPVEDEDQFFDAVETFEAEEVAFEVPAEEVHPFLSPDETLFTAEVLTVEVLNDYAHMSIKEVESVQRHVVECQNVDWSVWGSVDPDSLYTDFDAGTVNIIPVPDEYGMLRSVAKHTLRDGVAYLLRDQKRKTATLQDLALRSSIRGFIDSILPFPGTGIKTRPAVKMKYSD